MNHRWFVQSSYNPDTKKKLLEKVEKMNINIESCVVLEPYRVYGHSYFYDTFLLQKKFGVLFEMNEYSRTSAQQMKKHLFH
jgi:hypothetical protein